MKYLTRSILKLTPRKSNAKKGDYGKILVVAGSDQYPGAAMLAANAAISCLRSGADWVTVMAPEKTAWAIQCNNPDIITIKLKGKEFQADHVKSILEQCKKHDVLLIGPGIGKKAGRIAKSICEKAKLPKVIDADAVKAVNLKKIDNSILTPHPKEFELLLKNSRLSSKRNDKNYFRKHIGSNVIILKGKVDTIMSKTKTAHNKTGNAVMAKAGTGDVLAGLCAGFLVQTKDIFRSACMAAYLNGAIGDRLYKKKGRTYIASDLVDNIHLIFK